MTTTSLHKAIQDRDFTKAQKLIELGAPLHVVDETGGTPLHLAASIGNADLVKLLLEHGAQVDEAIRDLDTISYDSIYATPLQLASEYGQKKVVQLLLTAGANVNTKSKDNTTPLYRAVKNSHSDVVQLLIQAGATVNSPNFSYLMRAIHIGNTNIVRQLIQAGENVNGPSPGYSPIVVAAYAGNLPLVKLLLEFGAEQCVIAAPDGQNRMTAYEAAAIGGHKEITEILKKCTTRQIDDTNLCKIKKEDQINASIVRSNEQAKERKARLYSAIRGVIGAVVGYFAGGLVGLPISFIWSATGGNFNSVLSIFCILGIVTGGYLGAKGKILT